MPPASPVTYHALRDRFRWDLPARFNIGTACCDDRPPDAVALVEIGETGSPRSYSFGDIKERSDRLANGLRGLGVQRGDRVGIVVPQSWETAVTHLAVYKLGAIALPLSILFGPDALAFRLKDAGARVAVVEGEAAAKLDGIRGDLDELEVVLVVGDGEAGVTGSSGGTVRSFDEVLRSASPHFAAEPTMLDDPALLIYTSGTTGPPKGALHAHRVLLGHLPGFELSHEFAPQEGDRMWTPADWAWIGGLLDGLLPSWYHGTSVVAAPRQGFDPAWAADLIATHGIRNAFLPPTALRLMRQGDVRLTGSGLRSIGSGGEVLGEEMLSWARDNLGVTINEFYGQTEANYVVGNCASAWEVRPGSMGRPYPGHRVEVVDPSGAPVADGALGEVAVQAPDPVMFLAYWGRPEATADKFVGDWALTGDTAIRDSDGYLWFRGRQDDLISSAGYRIGPTEIEDCLIQHDAVTMAAVIGIPDETRGQIVKAFVIPRSGVTPSDAIEESIRAHVKQRLAAYEYPRVIEFVEELPMTTTGKIQRAELRKRESR